MLSAAKIVPQVGTSMWRYIFGACVNFAFVLEDTRRDGSPRERFKWACEPLTSLYPLLGLLIIKNEFTYSTTMPTSSGHWNTQVIWAHQFCLKLDKLISWIHWDSSFVLRRKCGTDANSFEQTFSSIVPPLIATEKYQQTHSGGLDTQWEHLEAY